MDEWKFSNSEKKKTARSSESMGSPQAIADRSPGFPTKSLGVSGVDHDRRWVKGWRTVIALFAQNCISRPRATPYGFCGQPRVAARQAAVPDF
jgi:hypothetical protein